MWGVSLRRVCLENGAPEFEVEKAPSYRGLSSLHNVFQSLFCALSLLVEDGEKYIIIMNMVCTKSPHSIQGMCSLRMLDDGDHDSVAFQLSSTIPTLYVFFVIPSAALISFNPSSSSSLGFHHHLWASL